MYQRFTLTDIPRLLSARPARLLAPEARRAAAVAMLLREEAQTVKMLFIERGRRENDPWSGDLGFPGGKIDDGDLDARHAAIRETQEEIGVDLRGARCLGRLDDIVGDHLPILISCFLFHLEEETPFTFGDEVVRAFWIPLAALGDPARHIDTTVHFGGVPLTRPAIDLLGPDEPVLWGITYRLVRQFLGRLEESPFWPGGGRSAE